MRLIDRIHRILSKNNLLIKVAVKLRNQCNILIGLNLAPDHVFEKTGEYDFLKIHAGKIKVFMDIGANLGEWTGAILNLNPKAEKGFLFEPNPYCVDKLTGKFSRDERIQLIAAACSDHTGISDFYAEDSGGETSSLGIAGTYGARKIQVSVTTVDLVMEQYQLTHIDFLKVDVEGFDLHVLRGAEKTLKEQRVDIIQFEYNTAWRDNGSTLTYAFNFLNKNGYETYCLTPKGLKNFDVNYYREFFNYSNFISLKKGNSNKR